MTIPVPLPLIVNESRNMLRSQRVGLAKTLSRSPFGRVEVTQKPSPDTIRSGPGNQTGVLFLKPHMPACFPRPSGVILARAFLILFLRSRSALAKAAHWRMPRPCILPAGDISAIALPARSLCILRSAATSIHCFRARLAARPSGVMRPRSIDACEDKHCFMTEAIHSMPPGARARPPRGWLTRSALAAALAPRHKQKGNQTAIWASCKLLVCTGVFLSLSS
jgi:hypothetical protein